MEGRHGYGVYGKEEEEEGMPLDGYLYGEEEEDEDVTDGLDETSIDFDDPRIANLPRIVLMGPRRAGKTSIQRVVFHKMSPHETLFRLEATQTLERAIVDHTPLCHFTIWDFPGDYYGSGSTASFDGISQDTGASSGWIRLKGSKEDHARGGGAWGDSRTATASAGNDAYVFQKATALIFVIDAQDEPYDMVLQSFTETVTRAIRVNPHIAIEVFINKVDGELFLSDEAKYDCRRDVMQQVSDELTDAGILPDSILISYHLTSIYDHSVFEAFSKVVQKLIPQLPTLETLLNVFVSTCSMEKAYLFDVASKLYICTDSSPVDMQSVELCSDMIDVVLDVSGIYGAGADLIHAIDGDGSASFPPNQSAVPTESISSAEDASNNIAPDIHSNTTPDSALDYSPPDMKDELVGTLISQGANNKDRDADGAGYDGETSSIIRLGNGMVLYLKEVDTNVALVCLSRAENFRKKSLINYNITCLKKALRELIRPSAEKPR